FACRFIAPAEPMLVAVGGLSGTGKSVLARALAADLAPPPGAVILRSDLERKALFEKAETEKLAEDAYAAPVTARVFATLADQAIARAQESYDLGPMTWIRIDASGTADETLARARTALGLVQAA